MANIKAWFRGTRKIWFAGAAAAIVVLAALENSYFLCHPHLELLLREVAFALLIASIFGLTIEQIQRSEFIRLVTEEREVLKRDVFLYAYGSELPNQIRQQIQDTILQKSFQRSDLVIDWEFNSVPGQPETLELTKGYSYKITNTSNDTKNWEFSFIQIGADEQQAIAESKFVVLKIRKGDEEPEEYRLGRLKVAEVPDQPHAQRTSIDIPIAAHSTLEIYYEVVMKRKLNGEDTYHSKDSVSGTTKVRLRFPGDFDVTVCCRTKTLRCAADNAPFSRYSYEWREGMLPYQGITISWSKREPRAGRAIPAG